MMAKIRIYLALLLTCFLLISSFADAQPKPDSAALFSVDQLVSDFQYFRAVLEKAHPSLYRYSPKDSVDHYFDKALSKLNHPMTEIQFWHLLQLTTSRIRSGHTQLFLSEASIKKYNNETHLLIPFHVYINNNQLFVKNYIGKPDTSFQPGDEIISIDGKTDQQLFNEVRTLIPGDGHATSFKNFLLEEGEFNRLYNQVHPQKQEFSILFKSTKGVQKLLTVKGAPVNKNTVSSKDKKTPDQFLNEVHFENPSAPAIPDSLIHSVYFQRDMPSTMFVKIRSFTYSDYLAFHRWLFETLNKQNIKDLVIDLKGNQGGIDYICIDLMKYLFKDNFFFTQNDEGVVDIKKFNELLAKAKDHGQIDLSLLERKPYTTKYPANELQKPYPAQFNGRLHLLVNGGTFSAASLLAVALKSQRQCTVYGTETGGGKAGCDGGDIVRVTLPQTGLQLSLPLLWTNSLSDEPNIGRGLKPDFPITHTWIDIDYYMIKFNIKKITDAGTAK